MASISVRTLHFYDEMGLLRPSHRKSNGYRIYEEKDLLRLQQILFFRELEFSLEQIKEIVDAPGFDVRKALKQHRNLIEMKQARLTGLLHTIDITIKKMNKEKEIKDEELYGSFSKDEMEKYKEEAKQRWGHTDAYKQSQERVKHWTKADYDRVQKEGYELMEKMVAIMSKGAKSKEAQALIVLHRAGIDEFYTCSDEMYRGFANMYVDDSRFAAYYEKHHKDLPKFMREAMLHSIGE